ncbi:acyltransferase family protein [Nocardioides marmoraquaticus]
MSSPPATAEASRAPRPAYLPGLDTVRGVGALAVLTTHVAFWAGSYTAQGVWGVVLARLDVGVAIFFVLSGFLLSRPWFAAAQRGGPRPATGRYLWHRVLRIVPLYVVTVVLALTFVTQDPSRGPLKWLTTLLMLDTYVADALPAGLTQMWSLSVEVAFYLLLPLVMLLAVGRGRSARGPGGLRTGRCAVVLGVMVAVSVAWHLVVPATDADLPGLPGQWLPGYLSWFAVGLALALVHVLHTSGRAGRVSVAVLALGRQPGVCWALAGGALLVSATPLAGPTLLVLPTAGETLVKHVAYAVVGGLVVLSALSTDPAGRYHAVLQHPWCRHLGVISFGVFCLHLPVLHGVMWVTGWSLFEGRLPQIWLATVVVSLVAAELSYRLVELPAMRLRGWPGRRVDRSPARASATSTGASAR